MANKGKRTTGKQPKRKVGRPGDGIERTKFTLYLPTKLAEKAADLAYSKGLSVSATIMMVLPLLM